MTTWSHCPIVDILRAWGNEPKQRADGRWSSGHEPVHSSSSGTCLSTNTERGLWYCSSCEQGGGALAFVAGVLDSRVAARRWLRDRYGAPLGHRSHRSRAPRHWTAVL